MPPQIFRKYSHFCFERRFSEQNSLIRLKSNILPPQIFGLGTPLHVTVVSTCILKMLVCSRGETRGERGHKYPGAELLRGAPRSPNNVTSTFFNAVDLPLKDISFEHEAPNLLLAPGAVLPRYAPGLLTAVPAAVGG